MESKIKLIILLIISLFISCNKKIDENPPINDVTQLLDLSKYKLSANIINDSIQEYNDTNDNFLIKGNYNRKQNHKIITRTIYNKVNHEKYLMVEIFVENNIERNNQILFYQNNKIDYTRSKLYTVDILYKNDKLHKAAYNFYMPKSYFRTKNVDLIYEIITYKENSNPQKLSLNIKNNNHHYCEIDLSNYNQDQNILIGGLFSEYSYNDKSQEMGINEIFINDTIKIK